MVFYRKYRPQTIEELDSSAVRETLFSVFSGKSYPHAFLFTGPKGLGKTSTARIIAKVINCQSRIKNQESEDKRSEKTDSQKHNSSFIIPNSKIEPCNKCGQCLSITNGTNIDILEIDGASNRGIDEIRDLREKIKLSPAYANKKVYIIDEVHMLTTEAFNALLKTLEEPPAHAMFILCTTEPHKIPATISSRCFHISFKMATNEELARSFARIAKKEKLTFDKDALDLIANISDGSFRDGVKALEEIATLAKGEKITKELIEKKYKISTVGQQALKLIEHLALKDAKKSLTLVSKLVEQGIDIKYFVEELAGKIHLMLLKEVGVDKDREEAPSGDFTLEEIIKMAGLLEKAAYQLKFSVLPQLPLELLIVEWCGILPKDTAEQTQPKQKEGIQIKEETKQAVTEKPIQNVKSDDNWRLLIDKIKIHSHSIAGVLRGVSLKSWEKDEVILETGFKFHKEKLEETKARLLIEKVCEEISGKKTSVSIQLKQ